MQTKKIRSAFLLIAAVAVGTFSVGCGDDDPVGPTDPGTDPPTQPPAAPTEFVVKLSSPNAAIGGIQFTVNGTGITDVMAASEAHTLYTDPGSGSIEAIVLAPSLASGDVLKFSVPGGAEASSFTTSIAEVASTDNAIVTSSGYTLTVEAAP